MEEWKRIIKEETEKCRVTYFPTEDGKGTYPYVILPLESRMSPRFLNAVIEGMKLMLKDELKEATAIILPEAKAFLLSPMARETGLDLVMIRKRDYKLPDQIVIKQRKAYKEKEGKNLMYCVGLKKDDKPTILEDFVSSGGTMISTVKTLKKYNFEIVGIGTVYERGEGVRRVKEETGYTVKALARLDLIDKKPTITRFYGD